MRRANVDDDAFLSAPFHYRHMLLAAVSLSKYRHVSSVSNDKAIRISKYPNDYTFFEITNKFIFSYYNRLYYIFLKYFLIEVSFYNTSTAS